MASPAASVVFTDADGCLLDHTTYSFREAAAAVERLHQRDVPLILCSSKTRAELERLQQALGIADPFISENGGGLFVPDGYFPFDLPGARPIAGYQAFELGLPYGQVVESLRAAAESAGVEVVGFSGMTIAEVAADSGLSPADARLAKLREFDEPFRIVRADASRRSTFFRALARRGVRVTKGGRYFHAGGAADKGTAVGLLLRLYRSAHGRVVSVGLGDGLNDVPFLRRVDIPIVVSNLANGVRDRVARMVRPARTTAAAGPAGWHEAVARLFGNGCGGTRGGR